MQGSKVWYDTCIDCSYCFVGLRILIDFVASVSKSSYTGIFVSCISPPPEGGYMYMGDIFVELHGTNVYDDSRASLQDYNYMVT